MKFFFGKTTTFCFLYHLCLAIKTPMSFHSFENQFSKIMLHAARQEAFFGTPSLREASRKNQHNSPIRCIKEKNVPHKVTA